MHWVKVAEMKAVALLLRNPDSVSARKSRRMYGYPPCAVNKRRARKKESYRRLQRGGGSANVVGTDDIGLGELLLRALCADHLGYGREMHDGIGDRFPKECTHARSISDITGPQLDLPTVGQGKASGPIRGKDQLVSCLGKIGGQMTPYKSAGAGN